MTGTERLGDQVDVLIVMGSASDMPTMEKAASQLTEFGLKSEIVVSSAHRNPDRTAQIAREAEGRGTKVIIAGAGMAAALPGAVAAHTNLPVIGVPCASGALNGFDSLLSIAQMPPGIPVACVAINGAKNAAILAAQIIAVGNRNVAAKVAEFREKQTSA
jgi:5-(carboxyamino)imidazole ribonucleotide mutase